MFKIGNKVKIMGEYSRYHEEYPDYDYDSGLDEYIGIQGTITKIQETNSDEPGPLYRVDLYYKHKNGRPLHEYFYEKELKLIQEDWDD